MYIFTWIAFLKIFLFNISESKHLPIGYIGKVLEGFKLSDKPLNQRKHFPPPDLPRHYKPVHVFQKPTDCDVITKQKEQTAVTRGLALGEVGKYILLKSEMFLTYQNTKIAADRWFLRVLQVPPPVRLPATI